jgi:hypothetical protein
MKTVSIGYHCACNDFAVLATLNNIGGHMTDEDFGELVGVVASTLCRKLVREVVGLERQDTPDYVEVEQ